MPALPRNTPQPHDRQGGSRRGGTGGSGPRTPDGGTRRWTPEERDFRRSSSSAAAPTRGARAAKREARFGPEEERGSKRTNRGIDWYPGPRSGKRDERGGERAERSNRFGRNDRFDRPQRDDRGSRPERGSRSDRNEHPQRTDRDAHAPRALREDRFERPQRTARFDRSDRPAPREDRLERGERPQRNDRSHGGDRPQRTTRPGRDERPRQDGRFSRAERPQRDDSRSAERHHTERRTFRDAQPGGGRPDRRPAADPRRTRFEQRPSQDRDRSGAARGREPQRSGRDARGPRFEAPEDVVLDRLEADVVSPEDVAGATFAGLGLGEQITKALAELGATEPFPIQAATIPAAVQGRNVLGRGRTGSGKTIAFGAALVERLLRNWAESGRTGTGRRVGRAPRALVLAPTRELALQIDRTVQPIARAVGLYTTQIFGGVPQARQVGALAKGVDIVIGTPGRVEDLLEQGRLDLSAVEIAVLDEADHMAELGFLEPIQRLLRRIPGKGQRLMFSATLDTAVSQLVREFLPDPVVHEVADPEGVVTADHRVLVIESGEKLSVLTALLASADRSLVFARTRAWAERLADELDGQGIRTESLHGDLNQARRTRNLARFSEGRVSALVATDVAARGIHVDEIGLVVHADAAEDYKTYLHRSGRTGRAGASGTVVTLITAGRRRRFAELLERAGVDAEFVVLRPGGDPVASIRR